MDTEERPAHESALAPTAESGPPSESDQDAVDRAGPSAQPIVSVILTRQELQLLSMAIDAPGIPGLAPDSPDVPPAVSALALLQAEASLRARELADIDEAGGLVVHEAISAMVTIAAFATRSAFVFHIPPGQNAFEYYAHERDGVIVAHTPRDESLHVLMLLDHESLVQQIVTFCECGDLAELEAASIVVSGDVLARARAAGESSGSGAALAVLRAQGTDSSSAVLANSLGSPHNVSVITVVEGQSQWLEQREITILNSGDAAWLVEPRLDDDTASERMYVLTTVTSEQLRERLSAEIAAWRPVDPHKHDGESSNQPD